jgi:hypothetical protein
MSQDAFDRADLLTAPLPPDGPVARSGGASSAATISGTPRSETGRAQRTDYADLQQMPSADWQPRTDLYARDPQDGTVRDIDGSGACPPRGRIRWPSSHAGFRRVRARR